MTDYIEWILALVEEEEPRETLGIKEPEMGAAVMSSVGKAGIKLIQRQSETEEPADARGEGHRDVGEQTYMRLAGRAWPRRRQLLPEASSKEAAGTALEWAAMQPAAAGETETAGLLMGGAMAAEHGGMLRWMKRSAEQVRQSEHLVQRTWTEPKPGPDTARLEPAALDLAFQRDARRYDGAFTLY